jgi:small conductance mechanosensitive channel
MWSNYLRSRAATDAFKSAAQYGDHHAMVVRAEVRLNIPPLLASAGVLGLAIVFGAQKMVQSIITGTFILFEDVEDVVMVRSLASTVERLTIRSVR